MWWPRTVFTLRIAAVTFAGLVGLAAVLQHFELITLAPAFEPWVWGISLSIIALDNLGTVVSRKYHNSRAAQYFKMERHLMAMVIQLSQSRDLRFEELGASIYVASKLPKRSRSPVRLKRIMRFRPAGYPQRSGIKWTAATGTVGDCWTNQTTRHKNTHAIAAKYVGTAIEPAAYAKIPKETRQGFTCKEFNAIVGNYSEILAVPIWHGRKERKLVGVLTVDRLYQEDEASFSPYLNKSDPTNVAATAASAVGRTLYPGSEHE